MATPNTLSDSDLDPAIFKTLEDGTHTRYGLPIDPRIVTMNPIERRQYRRPVVLAGTVAVEPTVQRSPAIN